MVKDVEKTPFGLFLLSGYICYKSSCSESIHQQPCVGSIEVERECMYQTALQSTTCSSPQALNVYHMCVCVFCV